MGHSNRDMNKEKKRETSSKKLKSSGFWHLEGEKVTRILYRPQRKVITGQGPQLRNIWFTMRRGGVSGDRFGCTWNGRR